MKKLALDEDSAQRGSSRGRVESIFRADGPRNGLSRGRANISHMSPIKAVASDPPGEEGEQDAGYSPETLRLSAP